jgi:hypothetical protein
LPVASGNPGWQGLGELSTTGMVVQFWVSEPGLWVLGSRNWVRGTGFAELGLRFWLLAARLSGCKAVRVSGCQGVRVSGCQGVRVSGCQGVRVSGCPAARLSDSNRRTTLPAKTWTERGSLFPVQHKGAVEA